MITPETKLYVQLQPDAGTRANLLELQQQLETAPRMRLVSPDTLHLTITHIGKVERVVAALRGHTSLRQSALFTRLETLIEKLRHDLDGASAVTFRLQPIGFELFGQNATTYVLSFDRTPQLEALHAQSLTRVREFLQTCEIRNTDAWMEADENFKHALSLRPHVTIAKAYTGPITQSHLPEEMNFTLMPLVY